MISTSHAGAGGVAPAPRYVAGIGLSAVYSAAVSYAVLVLAARTLPAADNASFLAFWALLFVTFGVFTGIHPEVTRAVISRPAAPTGAYPRPVLVAVLFSAAVCLLIALTSFTWAERVLGEEQWLLLVVLVAAAAFAVLMTMTGSLTGRAQWRGLIWATAGESTARLIAVLLVVAWIPSLAALAVASAIPAMTWILLLLRRDAREALQARGAEPLWTQLSHVAHACVASASSAALLVGFPVVVRLTTPDDEFFAAAGLLLAVTLTRAPLMVPLNAYQGVLLGRLMRHDRGLGPALLPVAAGLLSGTLVAAALAGLVGPALFQLLLGQQYEVSGALLLSLTLAAGLLALLTLTGASCLALGRHGAYSGGWLTATGVSALLLLAVPAHLETRVAVSLLASPLVGVLVHGWFLRAGLGRAVQDPAVVPWPT